MAKICEITGKSTIFGNKVSHANNKTRRSFAPNLQVKKLYIPDLELFIVLKLSNSALRTIHKNGITETLRKAYKKNTLAPRLRHLVAAL